MKKIIFFAVITVLVGVLWFLQADKKAEDKTLFPDFKQSINEIDKITIKNATSEIIINRNDGVWFLKNYPNLPVKFSAIRQQLSGLSNAIIIEEKTKNPDNYPSLSVDDPKTATNKGTNITLFGGKKTTLSFVAGKSEILLSGATKPDYYIRVNDTVYLVRNFVPFFHKEKDYLDNVILSIDRARLQSISWQGQDEKSSGSVLRAIPEYGGKWLNEDNSPAPAELTEKIIQPMISYWFDSLNFSDVLPISEAQKLQVLLKITIKTFDGMQITMNIHNGNNDTKWAILNSSIIDDSKIKKLKNKALLDHEIVLSDVNDLNIREKSWAFNISSYPLDFIIKADEKKQNDLMKNTNNKK